MLRKHLRRWLQNALIRLSAVAAGLFLAVTDIGLRLFGYASMCRILIALSPSPNQDRVDTSRAKNVGSFVNFIASSRWLKSTCLRRSLVAWWVLRWRGIPSELRFGVNVEEGHAWVEHHGVVVNDRPDIASRYRILYGQELMPESIARRI
jgi:hypothetical protein